MATPTGTQAVDRAVRLVTEVVHAADSVTFTELATATGLAKSTTSRLLVALERGGLVRRDDDGRFRPGDVFVRYAWRGGAEAGLIEVARPFLDRLGAQTGETVNLGVARDGLVEQIAQVDSKYLIGGTNWVGRPVPLHCAALGKVLLAYGAAQLPPGRLEARTSRTLTSRAALEENLRQVRRCGYAVTDEELEPGLVAVAAPVFRDGAVVVGALSVSAPASRLGPAQDPRGGRAVRDPGARPVRGPRPPPAARAEPDEPANVPGHEPPGPESPASATERRCLVTQEELLRQLYDFTLVGNAPEVLSLTNAGLEMGLGPETLLYEALIPSLEEVGARFERGDFFVPEMLIAGKAMAGRAGDPPPAAGRDRRRVDRHDRDGHGQGRRARHRQEPGQHHVRGGRVPGHRPRRPGRAGEVHRRDRASTSRTSSASPRS